MTITTQVKLKPFGKREVSVTLTGEEWTALMAKMSSHELSDLGIDVCHRAVDKLMRQITASVKGAMS